MKDIDGYAEIRQIQDLLASLKQQGRQLHKFTPAPYTVTDKEYSAAKKSSIVLRTETYVELGGPMASALSLLACTENDNLVEDETVLLLGDDIPALSRGVSPWGQIILVGGENLEASDYYTILDYAPPPGIFEGFMLKNSKNDIWCRVSEEALKSGLNCGELGRRMIAHLKWALPQARRVSVIYISSCEKDITTFECVADAVREKNTQLRQKIWAERGVDLKGCVPGGHCGACKNTEFCSRIRKIQKTYENHAEVR